MIRTAQLIAVVSIALATGASRAEEGCSKDTDCKGERICVQRECVDTEARAEMPANAVPASFKPAPSPAASSTPPETSRPAAPALESTVNRHLGGFVRPDLGFGYLTASASPSGSDVNINGFAGTFGIAVGGAISENQIVAFHLWDMVVTNPTITAGYVPVNNLTLIAFGPEFTTYSKDNFYASFSPALTRVSSTSTGGTADSNYGFGLRAALGKEWWASDHWGLGLAAHVSFSVNQFSGTNQPTWTGWGATLAFSATYN